MQSAENNYTRKLYIKVRLIIEESYLHLCKYFSEQMGFNSDLVCFYSYFVCPISFILYKNENHEFKTELSLESCSVNSIFKIDRTITSPKIVVTTLLQSKGIKGKIALSCRCYVLFLFHLPLSRVTLL